MNELPYFKMYPKDWLLNLRVLAMDARRRGAYIHLLCHDWISDGIPEDIELCAQIGGVDIETVSDIVKNHFTEKINGKLCNKKLLLQKTELKKTQKERIKAIRKRWTGCNTNVLQVKNKSNTIKESEADTESEALKAKEKTNTLAQSRTKKVRPEQLKYEDGIISGFTEKDLNDWQAAFPAVDIKQSIASSGQWLKANPQKMKKNFRRFLVNRFSFLQEHGGNKPANPILQNNNLDDLPWLSPYWNPKGLSKGEWARRQDDYARSIGLEPRRMTDEQKRLTAEYVRSMGV